MDNVCHILDPYHTALRTINVETMKNVLLQETQLMGNANPNWILLENIAEGTMIAAGIYWKSVIVMNVPKSFPVKVVNFFAD